MVHSLCEVVAVEMGKDKEYFKKLISFVKDRPGHDQRYAINCDKLKSELGLVGSKLPARPCDLGWKQSVTFDEGLVLTVKWYLENREWIENIKSGDYMK